MYIEHVTRYEITYATNQLARAMSKPTKTHVGAANSLLCYLAGSTDFNFKARAMSTMEAELVTGALATREADFCSNMMMEQEIFLQRIGVHR